MWRWPSHLLTVLAAHGFVMIKKILKKYREEGMDGIESAVLGRIVKARGVHPIQGALRTLRKKDFVCIVQIGAFVGATDNDPICSFLKDTVALKTKLKAVLVEPVKEYYDKLKLNYHDLPGVHFENVAIAQESGPHKFYRLGVDPVAHGFPSWLAQLGSLKEERMTTMWDNCERSEDCKAFYLEHRVVETIDCITSHQLFDRHGIKEIDLLQIDAEGYDYEILRTVDFKKVRPRFINYERMLLLNKEPECRAMMRAAGYRLIDFEQDTFCVRKGRL